MLDRILEVGRNEHGLFYDAIDPVDGTVVRKMPMDWPRINQFPEWFTVEADKNYTVETGGKRREVSGKALAEGLPLHLKAGEPLGIRVIGAETGE
jgi:hypothetical protein